MNSNLINFSSFAFWSRKHRTEGCWFVTIKGSPEFKMFQQPFQKITKRNLTKLEFKKLSEKFQFRFRNLQQTVQLSYEGERKQVWEIKNGPYSATSLTVPKAAGSMCPVNNYPIPMQRQIEVQIINHYDKDKTNSSYFTEKTMILLMMKAHSRLSYLHLANVSGDGATVSNQQ